MVGIFPPEGFVALCGILNWNKLCPLLPYHASDFLPLSVTLNDCRDARCAGKRTMGRTSVTFTAKVLPNLGHNSGGAGAAGN